MNLPSLSDGSATDETLREDVEIVSPHLRFPKAELLPPKPSGYVLIAAELDRVFPFRLVPDSHAKREAIARALELANKLEHRESVIAARVFVAHLIPPAVGRRMEQVHRQRVRVARFDLVVLFETKSLDTAAELQQEPVYEEFVRLIRMRTRHLHIIRARNGRRLGDVNHGRDGVFLFNFFHADDLRKLIPTWEYTAGWFQEKTGLDNSEVLVPAAGEPSQYGIINHCRWDRWRDILPDLMFRPTFHSYVMGNFDANGVVPMPILYRLAAGSQGS